MALPFAPRLRVLGIMMLMIGIFMCLSIVSAWSNTTFNNSLGSEVLSFDGINNVTRYLAVPSTVSLISRGYFNLSGYATSLIGAFNSTSNIKAYYKLDETSGTTAIDSVYGINGTSVNVLVNQTGKVNKAYNFTITSTSRISIPRNHVNLSTPPISINMWVYIEDTTLTVQSLFSCTGNNQYAFYIQGSGTGSQLTFGKCAIDESISSYVPPTNTWIMLTMTYDGSTVRFYANGTQVDTNVYSTTNWENGEYWIGRGSGADYFGGIIDEVAVWNRILSPAEITELYNGGLGNPYVSNNPSVNTSLTIGTDLVNITVETNGTIPVNITTPSLVSFVNKYLTPSYLVGGNYLIPFIFSSTNAGNLMYYALNFDNLGFVENSQTYNATTYETSTEGFTLNITYDNINYPTILSYLNYNHTSYLATASGAGNTKTFSYSVLTPPVSTTTNIPFYWEVQMTDSLGTTYYYNSTSKTQAVSKLIPIFTNDSTCPSGFNTTYIFSFADETTGAALKSNVTYNINYGVSTSGSYVFGNLSNIDKLYICINSSSPTYTIESGEISYSTSGYTDRKYYLFKGTRTTAVTSNITLYSLANALATSFSFTVQDNRFNPQVNAFLSILRWYPAENSYKIVEMGRTDSKGQTVARVKTEDVDYRIGIYTQEGTLIKLFEPIRFVCTTSPCTYNIFLPSAVSSYQNLYGLADSLTFNSTSKTFTYIWNDATQATTSMNLTVYKDAYNSATAVCSLVGTGFTGLLSCDVSSAGSGSFRAEVYRAASPAAFIRQLLRDIGSALSDTANGRTIGLLMAFILFVFAFLAGMYSPVAAIVLGAMALIPAAFVGAIGWTVFIGICLLGFVLIHFLRRA